MSKLSKEPEGSFFIGQNREARILNAPIISLLDLMISPQIRLLFNMYHSLKKLENQLMGMGTMLTQQHVIDEANILHDWIASFNLFLIIMDDETKTAYPHTCDKGEIAIKASKRFKLGQPTVEVVNSMKQDCFAIIENFVDESFNNQFLIINSEHSKYYLDEKPFGQEVFDTFPDFREDIVNASKCLALDQHEASLYHAVGVMERCMRFLGHKVRIKNAKNKEWGGLIGEVDALNKKWNPSKPTEKAIRDKISGAITLFYNANKAYRIYIAHKKTPYKRSEAERIYSMARDSVQDFVGVAKLRIPKSFPR